MRSGVPAAELLLVRLALGVWLMPSLLRIVGIALVLSSAVGVSSRLFGVPKTELSIHDTYFVVVRLSPIFLVLLFLLGILIFLYGSRYPA